MWLWYHPIPSSNVDAVDLNICVLAEGQRMTGKTELVTCLSFLTCKWKMVEVDPSHEPPFGAHCFKTSCGQTQTKVEFIKAACTSCYPIIADGRPKYLSGSWNIGKTLADLSKYTNAYKFKQGVGAAAEAYTISKVLIHLREGFMGPWRRHKVPAAPYSSSFFPYLHCNSCKKMLSGLDGKDRPICWWHIISIITHSYVGIK